jgi:hypothetical protein
MGDRVHGVFRVASGRDGRPGPMRMKPCLPFMVPRMTGPYLISQTSSAIGNRPTGSPVRAWLTKISSPRHLIAPQWRTRRTRAGSGYSGERTPSNGRGEWW